MNNATRPVAGTNILAQRTNIIGTDHWTYQAWEPTGGPGDPLAHSTITTIDGAWYGRIGTRRLPALLEALPYGSDERIERVMAWHAQQFQEAYSAIDTAFPEARGHGYRSSGDVSLFVATSRIRYG